MADIAHIAGLVATGLHPSPFPYVDVATTTTHKTLRGPRGGMIMATAEANEKFNFNKAVFPGIQGGPLMHVIAGKAVAFKEALQPSFKEYQQQILKNCQTLAAELQKRGFKVEIDDFGSGYSSLNLLKDIEANVIKIDRAFLKSIEQEKRSEIILNHIISMAKELDMSVITEGVETKKQLDMMSDMGCRMFQGFYFSKPIPIVEFEAKYFETN